MLTMEECKAVFDFVSAWERGDVAGARNARRRIRRERARRGEIEVITVHAENAS